MKASFNDYIVYVDESGDHGLSSVSPTYPVFVLAFCIFKKDSYCENIVPDLMRFKFKYFGHDQVILHERKIRKAEGVFHFLSNAAVRTAFFGDLDKIIDDSPFALISSVIQKKDLKAKYPYPDNPYNIAMEFGLERIYLHLHSNGCAQGTTHIVFESRGKREDADLELAFRRICARNATGKTLPFEIVFSDKRSNSTGLQLSDLIARPVGLSILRPEQPNRAYDHIKEKFVCDHRERILGYGLKVFP